jgi:hypothetical protein
MGGYLYIFVYHAKIKTLISGYITVPEGQFLL